MNSNNCRRLLSAVDKYMLEITLVGAYTYVQKLLSSVLNCKSAKYRPSMLKAPTQKN